MISQLKYIFGIPVQENLETHYTVSRDLIRNLRESRFTGFLCVEFWQYEGYIIFDTGNIIQGFEFYHDQESNGIRALIHIQNQLKKPEGSISTYKLDPEWIPLLLVSLQSRIVRSEKNLGEEGFKEFVESVLEETEYGFIRIEFGVDDATAHILILNKRIVSTVLQGKDGKQSREKGVGRLFPLVMKMCSTIKTAVYFETSDALESYVDGQKIAEMYDVVEASDSFLELMHLFKMLMQPYKSADEIDYHFNQLWEECCNQEGLNYISIHEERFEGLEQVSLEQLLRLIQLFTEKLKPELDTLLARRSLTVQIAEMFWNMTPDNFKEAMTNALTNQENENHE